MNRAHIKTELRIGLGIKFMTPYEMLRSERARFVLGGKEA